MEIEVKPGFSARYLNCWSIRKRNEQRRRGKWRNSKNSRSHHHDFERFIYSLWVFLLVLLLLLLSQYSSRISHGRRECGWLKANEPFFFLPPLEPWKMIQNSLASVCTYYGTYYLTWSDAVYRHRIALHMGLLMSLPFVVAAALSRMLAHFREPTEWERAKEERLGISRGNPDDCLLSCWCGTEPRWSHSSELCGDETVITPSLNIEIQIFRLRKQEKGQVVFFYLLSEVVIVFISLEAEAEFIRPLRQLEWRCWSLLGCSSCPAS